MGNAHDYNAMLGLGYPMVFGSSYASTASVPWAYTMRDIIYVEPPRRIIVSCEYCGLRYEHATTPLYCKGCGAPLEVNDG